MDKMEFEIRVWFKKGYGERMVCLKANELGRKIPSNADICTIFMRPIGSNDRDEQKIFEDDILEAPSGNLFIVTYIEKELRWAMKSSEDGSIFNINAKILKVVGNIHQNPNLIK